MNRILADVQASLKGWARSPSAVFFTLVFPLVLMGVFGTLFQGDAKVTLAVQDNDATSSSQQLLSAFTQTGAVELKRIEPGQDAAAVAKDKDYHTTLVIPKGYEANLQAGRPTQLTLISDPSRTQSRTAQGIVQAVLGEFNQRASGTPPRVTLQSQPLQLAGGGRFIDFFMPGVIGMTIMSNAIMGGLEVAARLRSKNILRKIATTPIRKWEWVLAKVLYQVVMAGISTAIIVLVGVLAFGVRIQVAWTWPLLVLLGAAMFAAVPMILSRWVKEEDQANAAGSSISFPMMFLSGTFFPLESMPKFLQAVASVLPLTYVNEGLRAAMITGNDGAVLLNGAVLLGMTLAAIAAGSLLISWKEV